MHVKSPGFEEYSCKINVLDKSDYVFEIEKNIVILKTGQSLQLKQNELSKETNSIPPKTNIKK